MCANWLRALGVVWGGGGRALARPLPRAAIKRLRNFIRAAEFFFGSRDYFQFKGEGCVGRCHCVNRPATHNARPL